jgi:hypothetical protein
MGDPNPERVPLGGNSKGEVSPNTNYNCSVLITSEEIRLSIPNLELKTDPMDTDCSYTFSGGHQSIVAHTELSSVSATLDDRRSAKARHEACVQMSARSSSLVSILSRT